MGDHVLRVRRKRKSQSRRLRRRYRTLAALALTILLVCGGFWLGLYLPSIKSAVSNTGGLLDSTSGRGNQNSAVANATVFSAPATTGRLVYPYSVIPGGVASVAELQAAILRDRLVARHYAGFDFKKARMVELRHARLAYLSYRMGEKIYWTRKLIALHVGEKLITDGTILARARCGNRLSDLPQTVVAPDEPKIETLENPIVEGGSVAQVAFPGSFESALLTRSAPFGFEPQGPVGIPSSPMGPISSTGFPGFFSPPIPGTCEPVKKPKPAAIDIALTATASGKKKKPSCSPNPPVVPEPGTMLLVASGISGIYLRYRRKGGNSSAASPNGSAA